MTNAELDLLLYCPALYLGVQPQAKAERQTDQG